ncbi:hypothetical protein ABZ687_29115 [Streptomyces ardesiacus]|uniref:hypothetical protein n=1 Tax=Streptomyces ardesiacus TaxID=285564 RepID=UPI0033C2BCEF
MTTPARLYKIINPGAITGATAGARIVFASTAPTGATITRTFYGRAARVLLDDYLVHDEQGSYHAAQVEVRYL